MANENKIPNPDQNPTKNKTPIKEPGQKDPMVLEEEKSKHQSDVSKQTVESTAPGGDIQPDQKGGVTIAPTPKKSTAA